MDLSLIDIIVAVLTFLVGALGSGLLTYVTTMTKITRLTVTMEGLKSEVELRNDSIVRDQKDMKADILKLDTTQQDHGKDINKLKVDLASVNPN